MNHEKWEELADIYVLGVLDAPEVRAFEEHLQNGCLQCAERVLETGDLLSNIGGSLKPVAPSPFLKTQILREIASEGVLTPTRKASAGWQVWAAAGAFSFTAIAAFLWFSPDPSATPALMKKTLHNVEMMGLLSEDSVQTIRLEEKPGSRETFGKLTWNFKRCGGCLFLKNLLQLPAGKVFQFWGVDESQTAVALGTFTADPDGNAHIDFDPMASPRRFGGFMVTIENLGGASIPTSSTRPVARF